MAKDRLGLQEGPPTEDKVRYLENKIHNQLRCLHAAV